MEDSIQSRRCWMIFGSQAPNGPYAFIVGDIPECPLPNLIFKEENWKFEGSLQFPRGLELDHNCLQEILYEVAGLCIVPIQQSDKPKEIRS
ncbi:hypothetical protein SAMN04487970_10484 [Paenibacillus tianmuensis]|uniref:Uncharacterized protein n=1 Tax=Paenibacillus tianmuensis TaxID=624147 RepID=A0A1G4TC43_9BACL|nr:hypothetical protein SAMN04487970_10484 [Paenibacillus tianmuensis]